MNLIVGRDKKRTIRGVNSNKNNSSLTKRDHNSGIDACLQVLSGHNNEVWIVMFSHNGNYLASASSDCTAIIWKVEKDDTLTKKHCLEGHQHPISFVAWSPNDKMLLTLGSGESLRLWNTYSGECNLNIIDSVDYSSITACAWFPNSEKLVYACSGTTTASSPNRIFTCDLEGQELEVWIGDRIIYELAVTPDGQYLIYASKNEIWIRELPNGREWRIHEDQTFISSLSLSGDGQSLTVNLGNQEIHVWNYDGSSTVPKTFMGHENEKIVSRSCFGGSVPETFTGHKSRKFVIRSCFGGSDSLFLASGSEDSKVYIWRRGSQTPIKVLRGHSMVVSCVSWNPTRPHMLASASDDHTIRIWLAC
ncbi:hypothetical protein EJB05_17835, partial [Eragrostis curvula]